jgi:hypothetical protein
MPPRLLPGVWTTSRWVNPMCVGVWVWGALWVCVRVLLGRVGEGGTRGPVHWPTGAHCCGGGTKALSIRPPADEGLLSVRLLPPSPCSMTTVGRRITTSASAIVI